MVLASLNLSTWRLKPRYGRPCPGRNLKTQKILKIRTYGNNRRTESTISGSGGTGGCVRSFCNRERSETPVHHREKWQKPRKCQKRSKLIPFSFTNSHFVEMPGTGYRKFSNPQKLHICAVSLKKPEVQTPSPSRKTLGGNALDRKSGHFFLYRFLRDLPAPRHYFERSRSRQPSGAERTTGT